MISRTLILALVAVAATPPLIAWSFRAEPKPPQHPTISERLRQVDADLPSLKKTDRLPEVRLVRTIPITQPAPERFAEPPPVKSPVENLARRFGDLNFQAPEPKEEINSPPQRRAKPHRRAALRGDVCSRHGQRKVMVGKYRWRCRK